MLGSCCAAAPAWHCKELATVLLKLPAQGRTSKTLFTLAVCLEAAQLISNLLTNLRPRCG